MLDLAERYGVDPGARARAYRDLGEILRRAGLSEIDASTAESKLQLSDPDFTVRGVVQGSDFALEVLELLPWAARQDVIGELVERGRIVCATTRPEERNIDVRTYFARGMVPDLGGASFGRELVRGPSAR